MKKVGIIGGTFDPIHFGHMIIAQTALDEFALDEILFIPSGSSYMKTNVSDKKLRLQMTGISIEDNPKFALSTIEVDREGNSYAYETIADLQSSNPNNEYYYIIGADTLFNMEKWMHPELIFGHIKILVASRIGSDLSDLQCKIKELSSKYGADIEILSINNIDISSTMIREKIKQNKSVRYLLHDKVIDFIYKNNLYKD